VVVEAALVFQLEVAARAQADERAKAAAAKQRRDDTDEDWEPMPITSSDPPKGRARGKSKRRSRDSQQCVAMEACAQLGPVLRPRQDEPQRRSPLSTVPFHQACCTCTHRSARSPNACSSSSGRCIECRTADSTRRRPDQVLPHLPAVSRCWSPVVFPMPLRLSAIKCLLREKPVNNLFINPLSLSLSLSLSLPHHRQAHASSAAVTS
jgi:hypothetical protein